MSLGGRVELVEQADKETYEGASEIFTFRDYRGGIPALVLVKLQNGAMRSFVAADMDDMSNSDDDNDFQDPPGAAAAPAAGPRPKTHGKMKLRARSTNGAAPTEMTTKRQKTATPSLTGGGARTDMTLKQRRLQAQAGNCTTLDKMFKAATEKTAPTAAAAAASPVEIEELAGDDRQEGSAAGTGTAGDHDMADTTADPGTEPDGWATTNATDCDGPRRHLLDWAGERAEQLQEQHAEWPAAAEPAATAADQDDQQVQGGYPTDQLQPGEAGEDAGAQQERDANDGGVDSRYWERACEEDATSEDEDDD